MRKVLNYKKKQIKNKTNNMENKKAGGEDTPSPEFDQEFELRTSAPQEEMERYYARKKASLVRKIRKINKKIKKNIYRPYISDNGKHKNPPD